MPETVITFPARYAIKGTHPDAEFREVAGDQFLGEDGGVAHVRGGDGRIEHVTDGWAVYRRQGSGQAVVCAPGVIEEMTGRTDAAPVTGLPR